MLSKEMFLEAIDEIATANMAKKYDYAPQGSFIGNKKSKVYHHPDCSYIPRMNEKNKIPTNNGEFLYRPCSHCQPDKGTTLTLKQLSRLRKKAIACQDQTLLDLFYDAGCKKCNTHDGEVKMYPDNTSGIKVQDKPGRWTVYFQCKDCGTLTKSWEARSQPMIKKLIQKYSQSPQHVLKDQIDFILLKEKQQEKLETRKTCRGNKFNQTEAWLQRHDHKTDGKYMGNANTGIYHYHGCSDVLKMNKEHKVPTNNSKGLYRACKHCKPYLRGFQTIFKETDSRLVKAQELIANNAIQKISQNTWNVHSNTNIYTVIQHNSDDWTCDCPDHEYRGVNCKHILATKQHNTILGNDSLQEKGEC